MFQNGEVEATIREAMFRKVWEVGFDEHISLAIGQNCERPMIRLEEHLVLCRMEEEAEADPGPKSGEPLDLRALLINQRADQDRRVRDLTRMTSSRESFLRATVALVLTGILLVYS